MNTKRIRKYVLHSRQGGTLGDREDIVDYLKEVKEAAAVQTDGDLANILGLSKPAVSAWRQRGSIPFKVQKQIYEKFGVSLLASKRQIPDHSDRRPHVAALIFLLANCRNKEFSLGTSLDTSYWWSRRFPYLSRDLDIELLERCRANMKHSIVARMFDESNIPEHELKAATAEIASDIEAGRILSLADIEALPYRR